MAYEVTAARRRPQKFEDLVGQEFVASTLQNSIRSGRIAHAYLFSGPRGCGKTSSARILAKSLNCESGPTATPCGHCVHCMEITRGASMDVIEIDGASNTSVNDVRQIKDEVMFPPSSSHRKIYIIDEVHMLSTSAFNALLKTIEEPPEYVVFIFATTELHKVPATIKSRCQQFNFRLVPVEQVKGLLAQAAQELGVQAEDEALYWIARESTGSIRDAYTLFDQVLAFSSGQMTYDKIRDKLGLVGIERLNQLFECCAEGRTGDAVSQLQSLLESGISVEQLVSNSADYLRNLLLITAGVSKESLLGQSAQRFSRTVLSQWSPAQIERALSLFLQLFRDLRYSVSPRFELELCISRLCWLREYVSSAELKAAIEQARQLLEGAPPVQKAAAAQSAPPAYASALSQMFQNAGGASVQPAAKTLVPQSVPAPQAFAQQTAPSPQAASLSPEELRAALIKEFSAGSPMLSAVLAQTSAWQLERGAAGTVVRCAVQNAFTASQIDGERAQLVQALQRRLGGTVSFIVGQEAAPQPADSSRLPEMVAFAVENFRGTVVGSAPVPAQAQGGSPLMKAGEDSDDETDAGALEDDSDE